MAVRIQHLNADATFLLSFSSPTSSSSTPAATTTPPFTLLLDPWLHSDAPVFHRKFSTQEHTVPCAITSLAALPAVPNAIVVSQNKSDHTHEGTLQELDWAGSASGTTLYAVPDAVKVVRGWPWFPRARLVELVSGRPVQVPTRQGAGGEYLEIEFLPAKHVWEIPALHSAVGIKYFVPRGGDTSRGPAGEDGGEAQGGEQPKGEPELAASVLFTPHGSPLSCVRAWVDALPDKRVDVLLHPLNRVETPLYLGGLISSGYPAGEDICRAAEVRYWVSTHDEDKKVGGFVAARIRKRCWTREEAQREVGEKVRVLDVGVGETVDVLGIRAGAGRTEAEVVG